MTPKARAKRLAQIRRVHLRMLKRAAALAPPPEADEAPDVDAEPDDQLDLADA